jgi:serine carboxypeptidase-like clade II
MNFKGAVDYYWSHGLMSDEVFDNITRHCNYDNSDGAACNGAVDVIDPGQIDPYNIYAPICVDAANGAYYPTGYVRHLLTILNVRFTSYIYWFC